MSARTPNKWWRHSRERMTYTEICAWPGSENAGECLCCCSCCDIKICSLLLSCFTVCVVLFFCRCWVLWGRNPAIVRMQQHSHLHSTTTLSVSCLQCAYVCACVAFRCDGAWLQQSANPASVFCMSVLTTCVLIVGEIGKTVCRVNSLSCWNWLHCIRFQ